MGGGPDINYPAQPSYGEGMADALKAQVQLLTGTGDFASTGSLESLLPLEESIRKKTAQTDTDILRQTLLGGEQKVIKDPETGKYGIPSAEPVTDDQGQVQSAGGGRYQIIKTDPGKDSSPEAEFGKLQTVKGVGATYSILDTETGGVTETFGGAEYGTYIDGKTAKEAEAAALEAVSAKFKSLQTTIDEADGDTDAVAQTFEFTNPNTGELLKEGDVVRQGDGMVDLLGDKRGVQNTVAKEKRKFVGGYRQTGTDRITGDRIYSVYDDEGKEIQSGLDFLDIPNGTPNATETTETVYEQVESGRQAGFDEAGNFLGLSAYGEDIQAGNLSRQRERDLQDVARLSGTYQDIMEDYKPGTQKALESARSVLESQEDSLTGAGAIGGPKGIADPLSLTSKGFDAAQNTTAVDLTTGTSFTGATVADPMSLTAKTEYDALADITGQELTRGTTYDPTANVTGGTFDAATSYNAAQAADPLALKAATSYDPSAGVKGTGYSAVAGLDGGQIQADSLRARLMKDAEAGLDQGLTDREERQIAEAARARSTMMGRTFDQSGAIAEAEARVAEDNARKMQNRAFAQSALGQEAGLQESDLGRGLQAAMQNQAAQNQALQYSSGQDMQAQLANQAATNQALQAGMAAGLSQEALAAQQKQAQEFANMQASNRASEFGVSAGMDQQAQSNQQALNAALANQQASNRAAEFGVQAGLGQEQAQAGFAQQANLANLAAEQQRQETGLQAGLGQEQLQASLAQQKAMADAGFTQQARAAGLEAELTQEQAEAQLNQQRLMANQQFSQEANKYGAQEDMQVQLNNLANQISNYQFETGAQMDADRLNEQLKQSGILGYIQAAGGLAALEDQSTLDPFQAVLGRAGGGSLQAGQSVFGQAGYGLNSGPAYLNPESGLGYIQNQATNAANMYNAQVAADATKSAGLMSGLGSLGGGLLGGAGAAASGGATLFSGFCWVAREVYGEHNPAWLLFRSWMLNESPSWFKAIYIKYGERFARFISNKPRLKARIRAWMDTKIRR
jgi:hypothetical protein